MEQVYAKKFENFWNKKGKYYIANKSKKKCYEKMKKLYENNSPKDIEDYIIKNKAEIMKKIQLEFYEFLKEEYKDFSQDGEDLNNINLKMTKIERQLDILKIFQPNFKIQELADKYEVDRTTIDDDLRELENGINFMGTTIKPNIKRDKTKRFYEDTVHPFFLALNMTETFAICKTLPDILKNYKTDNASDKSQINIILGLIERLQYQLSDYAKNKLKINPSSNITLQFLNEKDLCSKDNGRLAWLEKRGNIENEIIIDSKKYIGRFIQKNDKVVFLTKNDEEIVITDEVEIYLENGNKLNNYT